MDVNTKKIDKNKIELTVEVEEKRFEEGLKHAYKKIVGQINVPGFRKGKVPRKIIEQRFGVEVFYEDAVDYVMPRAYLEAIESLERDLQPVGKPEINIEQLEAKKPFIFKAIYDIKPEVELGEYKSFELEKIDTSVTEEEVAQELENLRQRHAQLEVVGEEEAIQNDDLVVLDFTGKKDGVTFEGGTAEDYSLEIGSGRFIPGFEEQLVGMKSGEEKTINITFPEEYHSKELAGQPVTFDVKIKEIKRKVFADLDDEFAKDISEFETLQELKEDLQNNLEKQKENMLKGSLRAQALAKITENMQVDIPEAMIETQIDSMLQDFDYRLRMQGFSLDKYLEFSQENMESIREKYKEEAIQAIKENLALEEIAKIENITVTEEDIEAEIKNIAENYNQEPEKVKETFEKQGQMESFKENLKMNKAIELVIDSCSLVDKKEEKTEE